MKVKIVLSLFASMILLVSCGTKNDTESGVKTNDSTTLQQEVEQEEDIIPSSSIGGGLGEPEAEKEIFKN